jgi:hypothetical protein
VDVLLDDVVARQPGEVQPVADLPLDVGPGRLPGLDPQVALQPEAAAVTGGQTVIGLGGNTGNVFPPPTPQNPNAGTHLHLTVQRPGIGLGGFVVADVVDPLPFLV